MAGITSVPAVQRQAGSLTSKVLGEQYFCPPWKGVKKNSFVLHEQWFMKTIFD